MVSGTERPWVSHRPHAIRAPLLPALDVLSSGGGGLVAECAGPGTALCALVDSHAVAAVRALGIVSCSLLPSRVPRACHPHRRVFSARGSVRCPSRASPWRH